MKQFMRTPSCHLHLPSHWKLPFYCQIAFTVASVDVLVTDLSVSVVAECERLAPPGSNFFRLSATDVRRLLQTLVIQQLLWSIRMTESLLENLSDASRANQY